jgi:hypothetical protein
VGPTFGRSSRPCLSTERSSTVCRCTSRSGAWPGWWLDCLGNVEDGWTAASKQAGTNAVPYPAAHLQISHDLKAVTNQYGLTDVGELEQDLVLGEKTSKEMLEYLRGGQKGGVRCCIVVNCCMCASHTSACLKWLGPEDAWLGPEQEQQVLGRGRENGVVNSAHHIECHNNRSKSKHGKSSLLSSSVESMARS